ncbi:hypothetical protein [Niabella hibiscisoli]|uniref:hypothetical protein n=1 Tax=Niabella hibiscisoli TaxID=1825928 RepID=UPI001F0FF3FC|nr:hypothetical protein [Niabella hibiscisoli]MCH5716430.1 hypothetical protein [Niabella hibiscisoli]
MPEISNYCQSLVSNTNVYVSYTLLSLLSTAFIEADWLGKNTNQGTNKITEVEPMTVSRTLAKPIVGGSKITRQLVEF